MIVTQVVLPVFFVIFLGLLLRRLGKVDERVFSRTQLYVLTPALIFVAMTGNDAEISILLKVLFFVASLSVILLAAAQAVGFLFKEDKVTRNAISLASIFSNSGFYGIPVCMLAFGEEGVVYAAIFVAGSSSVQSTLGIFVANAGKKKIPEAIGAVFKVPMIYAIIISKLLLNFDLLPPEPFMKMIDMLGHSAIPLGLLLLGMQLEKIIFERFVGVGKYDDNVNDGDRRKELLQGATAAVIKIGGGFAAGLLLCEIFGFDSLIRKVLIVEASMPTAVNAVVMATEFDCRPEIVTVGILASTVASIATITLVLNYLI
ncbi:MAG TPA: AEC family transporter [Candidatus Krumholzibacteriaceae bacterium]|nr:AEC family transporter [Candidatus Krumholzibacteriaceae bacterium]